jgi:hypothetical protein
MLPKELVTILHAIAFAVITLVPVVVAAVKSAPR